MASAPTSPTLTVFTDQKPGPMSLITLTLKAAAAPALLPPQGHNSVREQQTNGSPNEQRSPHTTTIKLEADHKLPPVTPSLEPNHKIQAPFEPSVKPKQPYHGLLMRGATEDTDDGYRNMFIRWEMRPLVGKHVAKNWRDILVFHDTDDEDDSISA